MTKPTEEEVQARIEAAYLHALTAEITPATPWWYLSFVDDEVFQGACVLQAPDALTATPRAHQLGIGAHGQVMIVELPPQVLAEIPPEWRNLKLSAEDVRDNLGGKSLEEWEDQADHE